MARRIEVAGALLTPVAAAAGVAALASLGAGAAGFALLPFLLLVLAVVGVVAGAFRHLRRGADAAESAYWYKVLWGATFVCPTLTVLFLSGGFIIMPVAIMALITSLAATRVEQDRRARARRR